MENFDLNESGVKEMGKRQLIEVNGGGPIEELIFSTFCLFVEAIKNLGPSINQANCERAAKDDYIPS